MPLCEREVSSPLTHIQEGQNDAGCGLLRWEAFEVLLDRWDEPEDGYYSVKSSSAVNKVQAWRAQRLRLNRTLWDMKRFFGEFPILQTASVELGVGREQLQPASRTSQSSACFVLLVC